MAGGRRDNIDLQETRQCLRDPTKRATEELLAPRIQQASANPVSAGNRGDDRPRGQTLYRDVTLLIRRPMATAFATRDHPDPLLRSTHTICRMTARPWSSLIPVLVHARVASQQHAASPCVAATSLTGILQVDGYAGFGSLAEARQDAYDAGWDSAYDAGWDSGYSSGRLSALNKELLRGLIQLCHPDRHSGRVDLATRVTRQLLELRENTRRAA